MVLTIIFLVSGALIALLLFTKVREMKTRRRPALLRVISLGDVHMKELSHRSAHFYADSKEDVKFFVEKQFPMHLKRAWGKTETFVLEKWHILAEDLRNAKVLKKTGNISDYFQSMNEAEEADRLSDEKSNEDASATAENRVE